MKIGISKNKAIRKMIWIFINGLFKEFFEKMKPFNSLFYSYVRIEDIFGEILENLLAVVKLFFDNKSLKLSRFFEKLINLKLKEDPPLIEHFLVNSLLLEELVKFLLSQETRKNEITRERRLADCSGLFRLQTPHLTSLSSKPKSIIKSSISSNKSLTPKNNPGQYYKVEQFEQLLKKASEKKEQIAKMLTKIEIENETNESQGSKNFYLFLYFRDAPYLMSKMTRPNDKETEKKLDDFLERLWAENNRNLLQNQTKRYFEGAPSKSDLRNVGLVSGVSARQVSRGFHSRSRLRVIRENEAFLEDQVAGDESFQDSFINSFFLAKFQSMRKVKDGREVDIGVQLKGFLLEEDRLHRIKDVIHHQHLIFNNPKFHRKKYLNITEIGNHIKIAYHHWCIKKNLWLTIITK